MKAFYRAIFTVFFLASQAFSASVYEGAAIKSCALHYATLDTSQIESLIQKEQSAKVLSLFHQKQYQEAAILVRKSGDIPLYQKIEDYIRQNMQTAEIVSGLEKPITGTSSEVYKVHFADGSAAIFKPDPEYWKYANKQNASVVNAGSEVAAYELNRAMNLGLVPVTIRRCIAEKCGSLQMFVAVDKSDRYDQGSWNRSHLFNYLIDHNDEHSGNRIVFGGGVVNIDHGLAFSGKGHQLHKHKTLQELEPDALFLDALQNLEPNVITEILNRNGLSQYTEKVIKARQNLLDRFITR